MLIWRFVFFCFGITDIDTCLVMCFQGSSEFCFIFCALPRMPFSSIESPSTTSIHACTPALQGILGLCRLVCSFLPPAFTHMAPSAQNAFLLPRLVRLNLTYLPDLSLNVVSRGKPSMRPHSPPKSRSGSLVTCSLGTMVSEPCLS